MSESEPEPCLFAGSSSSEEKVPVRGEAWLMTGASQATNEVQIGTGFGAGVVDGGVGPEPELVELDLGGEWGRGLRRGLFAHCSVPPGWPA